MTDPNSPVWHHVDAAPVLGRDVHVWRANLDRDDADVESFAQSLSPDEHARAARFHFRIDRRRYVIGRGVVRRLLAEYLPYGPAEVALCYNAHGKPALVGQTGPAGVKFNVTHSDSLLLVAVARGREVGVDVERQRPIADRTNLAQRYFSPREVAELARLPEEQQDLAFFACWTRKEAYLKAHGTGLALPLDQFAVTVDPAGPARLVATDHDPGQLLRWELTDVQPGGDFTGALACEGRDWQLWRGVCPW